MNGRRRNSLGQFVPKPEDDLPRIGIKINLTLIFILILLVPWLYYLFFRLQLIQKIGDFLEETVLCKPCNATLQTRKDTF
jgi:hypothetical protein